MPWPEIDLPKLAGVAGSTVGLIIATAIFQSWVTARYVPAFDRYRALTDELRGYRDENRRRGSLREQIREYRSRLLLMSWASCLLCWVMLCAIVTIATASAAVIFPPQGEHPGDDSVARQAIAGIGALAVAAGLILDVVAVTLVIRENRLDRRAIQSEAGDIDEVNGRGER